ncbi:hypothetical protein SNL152K_9288 [Streptomyces sp. NL15-2K]|nr:hypothetical protein SNL152K_9288 [Streptomyces sp. NL15-2K]
MHLVPVPTAVLPCEHQGRHVTSHRALPSPLGGCLSSQRRTSGGSRTVNGPPRYRKGGNPLVAAHGTHLA